MNLQPMAKQMLRKCGGLPLAIKEVGKQLAEKKVSGRSGWEQLLESVDFGSTLKLLEPFYQKLDPKLEPCFMCMAFFKENTTLRAEKLTQIWVAGGVVSRYKYESYLNGLINESVIDVQDKSTEYRMNHVLHMLSIQKAEEKLGFEILRNNGNNRPSESPRHHRVTICSRDKFNYSTDQDKHLVSLFFHGGGYLDASPSYWKSFKQRLKILDLEDFGLKILPETISTLMELRYLGLRNYYIKELPQSLGRLKNLEVLDIAQNFMMEVPDIIWEMDSLHHLYLSDVIFRKPLKIDVLQFLETLTYVSVDNLTYELSSLRGVGRWVCAGAGPEIPVNGDRPPPLPPSLPSFTFNFLNSSLRKKEERALILSPVLRSAAAAAGTASGAAVRASLRRQRFSSLENAPTRASPFADVGFPASRGRSAISGKLANGRCPR
ncbi:disease resistance protein RPM1-like [Salvia miltiorrhiza]|uniref:disease resistance protein RPM1-like n=1 Tax=Salvia miltiorrhiza TaxID=226208 RepID=UPI0025ABECFA|nr:disease resistance protein RPM1-like [Salvia miltiorrhiza]